MGHGFGDHGQSEHQGCPEGQLQVTEPVTIETAQPRDVLPDVCVVVARYGGLVPIAAPASTEVRCKWTPEFSEQIAQRYVTHRVWSNAAAAFLSLAIAVGSAVCRVSLFEGATDIKDDEQASGVLVLTAPEVWLIRGLRGLLGG